MNSYLRDQGTGQDLGMSIFWGLNFWQFYHNPVGSLSLNLFCIGSLGGLMWVFIKPLLGKLWFAKVLNWVILPPSPLPPSPAHHQPPSFCSVEMVQLFDIKLKGKQFVFISQRRRKNKRMLYYDCVHLYLIKMVAIYMQIRCDSASWQFVSTTLSITNHLCPYLSSPVLIWRPYSDGRPNCISRGCKLLQERFKLCFPGPPLPNSLDHSCSFLKMLSFTIPLFLTSTSSIGLVVSILYH